MAAFSEIDRFSRGRESMDLILAEEPPVAIPNGKALVYRDSWVVFHGVLRWGGGRCVED